MYAFMYAYARMYACTYVRVHVRESMCYICVRACMYIIIYMY